MIELALYFFAALGALCAGTLLVRKIIGIFNWFKRVNHFMKKRGGQVDHVIETNASVRYKLMMIEEKFLEWVEEEEE
jgi:hypothetical protein